jgi:hypothetical protein
MERSKAAMEWNILPSVEDYEEDSSSSSMSMYNLDFDGEDSYFLLNRTPHIVLHNAPLPMLVEELHSSHITEKVPFERHYVVQEEDHPSSYNIEEIFCSFTFNLHRKEISWRRVRKVKQSDGNLEELQEAEVLFKNTDEDPITVDIASTSLTQATAHNISVLNEKLLEAE